MVKQSKISVMFSKNAIFRKIADFYQFYGIIY